MFYEGLYLYQKTGVNTARTLYLKDHSHEIVDQWFFPQTLASHSSPVANFSSVFLRMRQIIWKLSQLSAFFSVTLLIPERLSNFAVNNVWRVFSIFILKNWRIIENECVDMELNTKKTKTEKSCCVSL